MSRDTKGNQVEIPGTLDRRRSVATQTNSETSARALEEFSFLFNK